MKKKISILLIIILSTLCMLPVSNTRAASSAVRGIDVSGKYNGVVDWEAVAAQGYTFAMIRIAEGQAPDVDSQFEANYEGAKAAGLKIGVYHDCCIRTPEEAVLEAKYCVELLNGRKLDYPVAYDMEKDGTFLGGIENTTAIANAYFEVIEDAGYTPMLYSYSSRLNNDFDWDMLGNVKVWVAHYDTDDPGFKGRYDIWQYTDKGDVPGANTDTGRCDINYSFMEAESVSIPLDEITLGAGETFSLTAVLAPEGCTDSVKYSSSNKAAATVNKETARAGQTLKIAAKAKGKTTITIKTGSGQSAKINVTVKNAPKSIRLPSKKTLHIGDTYQLSPKLSSGSASALLTYSNADKSVVSLSRSGKIRAKKKGTAVITVKTFNNITDTIKIVVN